VICTAAVGKLTPIAFKEKGEPNYMVNLTVDRIHKGDIQPGSVITIRYYEPTLGMNDRQELGDYALVFIDKAIGGYVFSKPTDSAMPVAKTPHTPYIRSDNIRANLHWEIINSLKECKDSYNLYFRNAVTNHEILTAADIDLYIKPFTESTDSKDTQTKRLAFALCVQVDNKTWLIPALDYMKSAFQTEPNGNGYNTVFGAIEDVKISPDQIDVIKQLLDSNTVEFRRLGSYILRDSGLKQVLPILKQALNDSDRKVRYNAVMGLARITGDNKHGPAMFIYDENEAEYLNYWKNKPLE